MQKLDNKTIILISIFGSILLLLLVRACFLFKDHEHQFGEWTIVQEADCTNTGLKVRECKECGDNLDYKMCIYFVKPGDTVWEIAKEFKVSSKNIIAANNLDNPDKIKVGERLYIMK